MQNQHEQVHEIYEHNQNISSENNSLQIHSSQKTNTRVAFANTLRGIAAVFVIIAHYFHNFWHYDFVIPVFLHDDVKIHIPIFAKYIEMIQFEPGAFGVSLFFCISGFVIPFSISRYSRWQFIKARFFRLWPTYAVCFCISMLFLLFYVNNNGRSFPYSWEHILAHLTMAPDIFNYRYTDIISWTIQLEIKFYLTCLIVYPWIRDKCADKLMIAFVLFSGLIYAMIETTQMSHIHRYMCLYYCEYVSIMFVGIMIFMHFKQAISTIKLSLYSLILFLLFVFAKNYDYLNSTGYTQIPEYSDIRNMLTVLCGVGVFITSYCLRDKFSASKTSLFSRLAEVSYSMYLIHPMSGLVLITLIYPHVFYGITISLIYTAVGTILMYKYVEKPCQNFMHKSHG
jgi:peptidoglycan/LPS O-acetylase OafA/YrhL